MKEDLLRWRKGIFLMETLHWY